MYGVREEARQGCNRGYVRKRGAWEEETGRGWARNYCHMTRMWRRQRTAEGPSPNGTAYILFMLKEKTVPSLIRLGTNLVNVAFGSPVLPKTS